MPSGRDFCSFRQGLKESQIELLPLRFVTVHNSGTDAFSSRKRGDTSLGDSDSNHDVPMKLGLSPYLTSRWLTAIIGKS